MLWVSKRCEGKSPWLQRLETHPPCLTTGACSWAWRQSCRCSSCNRFSVSYWSGNVKDGWYNFFFFLPGGGSQRNGHEGERSLLVGPSGDPKTGLSVVRSSSPEIKTQTSYKNFPVTFQGTYPSTRRLVNRTFIKMLLLEDVFLL